MLVSFGKSSTRNVNIKVRILTFLSIFYLILFLDYKSITFINLGIFKINR